MLIAILVVLWQLVCDCQIIPNYMLPSPSKIAVNFMTDLNFYVQNAGITLYETAWGLVIGIVVGFALSCLMERLEWVKCALLPILSITQTIPIIAIAPILVMFLGLGMLPKIVLVALVTFFPISITTLGGLLSAPKETIDMSYSCGAGHLRTLFCVKLPSAANSIFSALKVSVTYAFSAAVISEWLGGSGGIGVMMTRYKKSFDYTSMFSCVLVIIIVTLILIMIVNITERLVCKWHHVE